MTPGWIFQLLTHPMKDLRELFQAGDRKGIGRLLTVMAGELAGLVATGLMALGVCVLLLYLAKAVWTTFSFTHLGQSYRLLHPDKAVQIAHFYGQDLLEVAQRLVWLSIVAGSAVSTAVQVTYIRLFFYEPTGIPGRLIFWFIPFAVGISFLAQELYRYQWSMVAWICAVPCAMVLNHTLDLLARIVPDGLLPTLIFRLFFHVKYLCMKAMGELGFGGKTAADQTEKRKSPNRGGKA